MKIKLAFLSSHWAILRQIHQHNASHMTKMASMPIYGKNTLKIFFLGTTGLVLMKLRMKHQRPKLFIFCSNYDPEVKFCNLGFYMGKCDNDGFFGNYCIL